MESSQALYEPPVNPVTIMLESGQEMLYPTQREGWGPGCMRDRDYDESEINDPLDKEGERAARDKDPERAASDVEIDSAASDDDSVPGDTTNSEAAASKQKAKGKRKAKENRKKNK